MSEFAIGMHVVRVVRLDESGRSTIVQLWLAAVPRERAVAAVREAIPAGWEADMTEQRPTRDHVARLGTQACGVRQLTS